jgi:hemolysin activation/secretion protein
LGRRDSAPGARCCAGKVFGLTGLGDRTIITAFSTAELTEQQTLQVAHDFRLGSEGLALGGQFTYAWANPDFNDPNIEIQARTAFGTIEASYPLIRSESQTVRASAGLDYIDQEIDFNGLLLNQDRLRVAFLRFTGDAIGTPVQRQRLQRGRAPLARRHVR